MEITKGEKQVLQISNDSLINVFVTDDNISVVIRDNQNNEIDIRFDPMFFDYFRQKLSRQYGRVPRVTNWSNEQKKQILELKKQDKSFSEICRIMNLTQRKARSLYSCAKK